MDVIIVEVEVENYWETVGVFDINTPLSILDDYGTLWQNKLLGSRYRLNTWSVQKP